MAESEEELKRLLTVKEESEKAGLKLSIQKLRSWHQVPSLHGSSQGYGFFLKQLNNNNCPKGR